MTDYKWWVVSCSRTTCEIKAAKAGNSGPYKNGGGWCHFSTPAGNQYTLHVPADFNDETMWPKFFKTYDHVVFADRDKAFEFYISYSDMLTKQALERNQHRKSFVARKLGIVDSD